MLVTTSAEMYAGFVDQDDLLVTSLHLSQLSLLQAMI